MTNRNRNIQILLVCFLVITIFVCISRGAIPISIPQMISACKQLGSGYNFSETEEAVFIQLRLPRVLLCAVGGAILSVSGVLMQALFRNPIVEPGILGTSAGAALGASCVIGFAGSLSVMLPMIPVIWFQPIVATIFASLATYLVIQLSGRASQVTTTSLLLSGMSINAIAVSIMGFISYFSRDPQARSITFWNLGTFSGAGWWQCWMVLGIGIPCIGYCFRKSHQLNTLLLGYTDALYSGTEVKKLRNQILFANTVMVAVLTGFVGVIAFMGMIVPHIMRLLVGSHHRMLLPAAALSGAILLCLTDLFARTIIAPAELPIGIITSLIGAPLFIFLYRKFSPLYGEGGIND
ncbi:MAG: iron ABC transporter permease [Chitinophagia bacterium]